MVKKIDWGFIVVIFVICVVSSISSTDLPYIRIDTYSEMLLLISAAFITCVASLWDTLIKVEESETTAARFRKDMERYRNWKEKRSNQSSL